MLKDLAIIAGFLAGLAFVVLFVTVPILDLLGII